MVMEMVKKQKFDSFDFGLIMMAIGLFITNTKILYHLNPDVADGTNALFSYKTLNENSIISMIIASVFSITTISIIRKLRRINCIWYVVLILIAPYCIIDGIGVHLYYNTKMTNFIIFAAIYYGIYTVMILIFPALERMIQDKFTKRIDVVTQKIDDVTQKRLENTILEQQKIIELQEDKINKIEVTQKEYADTIDLRNKFIKFIQVDKLLTNEKKGRNPENKIRSEKLSILHSDLKNSLNLNGEIDNIDKEVLLPQLINE